MSKKVQKTLTGAMAAMMATGVVATPAMAATTEKTQADILYRAAYEATMKAESEKTQAAINEARAAIKALKEYAPKLTSAIGTFSSIVDKVQGPILRDILKLIDTAKAEPTQANINAAKAAITADLPDTWRNPYSSAVDKIQVELQTKATQAVKLAQETRKIEDIEAAKKLVAEIATSTSQAFKDWAEVRMAQLEAIKIYDLEVTKAELLTDGTGVKVEFTALEEALRNVNLEVIDNNGNVKEVELAEVLIEGETSYTFEFKNSIKAEDVKGDWTVNGLVVKQDEVNLVNYVLSITTNSDSETVFAKLKNSGLVSNLVDKVSNHKQYVAILANYVENEKIETVADIQEAIDKANKEVGTDVKVSDVVNASNSSKYTLGEFTELFNKLNLDRVNSEWVKDYRTSIFTSEDSKVTVSDIQAIVDKTNESKALAIFENNQISDTGYAELITNHTLDTKKINQYIQYVTDYVVVKENDKVAAQNKEAKLKSLNVALAVNNVNKADTVTSLKNALQNLSTLADNKLDFSYDENVNEALLSTYVKEKKNNSFFKASDVRIFIQNMNRDQIELAKVALYNAAGAYDNDNTTKKKAFVDALAKLEVVTAKEAKAEKFDDSIINEDLLKDYAEAIVDLMNEKFENEQVINVSDITAELKEVNTNLVTNLFKKEKLDKDTKDLFLERLNNKSLGLTNVVDSNKDAYFEDKALFENLTTKDAVINAVNVVNALVTINNANDVTTVKNALTTIAVLHADFGYINRTDVSKQDVAELLLAELNKDNPLVLVDVTSLVNTVNNNINIKLNNLLNEADKGINKTIGDATKTMAALENISAEYKAITNVVTKIEIAQAFNSNRPYTTDKDGNFVAYKDFTNLTAVRTLLAKVMK